MSTRNISVSAAIREGMLEEMRRDPNVLVLGEDIGVMGGTFALTRGFMEEFGPDRVRDTPISESGFMGMAVGMAMRGMRPIVELMYNDFITVSLDPLMNQAAKMLYMTGGQISVPMVLRAPMGAGRRNAGQHSQCLEALFMHIPGLKLVCPSTAYDAKGLIKSAIRDGDPVVVLEHKLLYAKKFDMPPEDEEYTIPLGSADVKREGKDITILTWSRQVHFALEAAETLAKENGISCEVVDLRTLVPLDWDTVNASVRKTHNVLTVEEGVLRAGVGAEISSQIHETLFDELDSPVGRVAGLNVVSPFSPPLEDANFPRPATIVAAVRRQLNV
ncbi:MAG TPA: alpha-ketoacid dehydrogenase subunit beta [Candidatus Limnocylindria bacterium]|nr:alpha-ketoacid dehydrogenase subunit beta [Candidatus Limnocylindria bacterium]